MSLIITLLETYLNERNKHSDSYLPIREKVKKYSGPLYAIRFSENYEDSKEQMISTKVGINVKSGWGNPRGVYAYQIDDFNNETNSSFATEYKNAYILERKPGIGIQIEDIGNLPRNLYEELNEKLKNYIFSISKFYDIHDNDIKKTKPSFNAAWINFLKSVEQNSRNKSDGGIFWYTIILLSQKVYLGALVSGIFKFEFESKEPDVIQTFLLRKICGITYVEDKANGIIHPNERSQCLFLDPRIYKVIEHFDNKDYRSISAVKSGKKIPYHAVTNLGGSDNYDITYTEFLKSLKNKSVLPPTITDFKYFSSTIDLRFQWQRLIPDAILINKWFVDNIQELNKDDYHLILLRTLNSLTPDYNKSTIDDIKEYISAKDNFKDPKFDSKIKAMSEMTNMLISKFGYSDITEFNKTIIKLYNTVLSKDSKIKTK
jgi:hypothetical protein